MVGVRCLSVSVVLPIAYNLLDTVAEFTGFIIGRKVLGLNRMYIMQRENKYFYPPVADSTKFAPVDRFRKLIRK